MSNMNELKDFSIEQLEDYIEDLSKELFELRNQLAMTRKLENPHLIKDKRRDVARAKFILAEKRKEKGEK